MLVPLPPRYHAIVASERRNPQETGGDGSSEANLFSQQAAARSQANLIDSQKTEGNEMFSNKARLQALRMAANGIEEYPQELNGLTWPIGFNHSSIETIAPSRLNRMVVRGDED
jgi:hypothetical protein